MSENPSAWNDARLGAPPSTSTSACIGGVDAVLAVRQHNTRLYGRLIVPVGLPRGVGEGGLHNSCPAMQARDIAFPQKGCLPSRLGPRGCRAGRRAGLWRNKKSRAMHGMSDVPFPPSQKPWPFLPMSIEWHTPQSSGR
ncbi:hypothetical protein ANO11243_023440 [Dothideomycetidae sp. 11243]|nr:hypothetical protein ANO11243_023440 [fungal sp. No.11243]